jgi:lipid-A-disaccharide synthase
MPSIMISCGEASGDLYAAAMARELRALSPGTRLFGLGGDRLRNAGAELVGDYHGLSVTGLSEAVRVLPRALRMHRTLVACAASERPDVLVVIDFPDFNFPLAKSIRKLGVPVVYYICPQLWAWRPGRMKVIKRLVSLALVIFPFEEGLYRRAGVPVEFVGHPLLDLAEVTEPRGRFLRSLGLQPDAPTLALLPGSRVNEVRAILPTLVGAVQRIKSAVPGVQLVVARAPNIPIEAFHLLANAALGPVAIVEGRADDVLNAADAVVTASGTATVQAAIHECPMVVVYRLSALTYFLGRPFVQVDTYGMVNLIAGERVVPELIQGGFTVDAVAERAIAFLTDRDLAASTRSRLREVRARLGLPGASRRVAEAVLRACRT